MDNSLLWGVHVEAFVHCKVGDLHQVKVKLNETGYHIILQHHVIWSGMQLVDQGFLLMGYNDPNHFN